MPSPPDYIALLQSLQHTATPTAADHQHYRAYVAKKAMSRDKTASAACTMLLSSALMYNISILWRLLHMEADHLAERSKSQLVSSAIAGVCWVLAHVLMELAFTCWVSRVPELYKRHRSSCIMVTRTGLLLLMSLYIPKTYYHTVAVEVHAGRAAAATLRLVTGFVAIHILEVLCFRLPTTLAVPYHSARVAFTLSILSTTLKVFEEQPALTEVACELWGQISHMYLSMAYWVLGLPLQLILPASGPVHSNLHGPVHGDLHGLAPLHSPARGEPHGGRGASLSGAGDGLCIVAMLLVFLNLSVGLIIPLYTLYVWEVSGFRAYLAAGDAAASHTSSTTSNGTSGSSRSNGSVLDLGSGSITGGAVHDDLDHQHQEQQQQEGGSHAGGASGSSSSRQTPAAASAVAAAGSGGGTTQRTLDAAAAAAGGSSRGGGLALPQGNPLLQAALAWGTTPPPPAAAAAAPAAEGPQHVITSHHHSSNSSNTGSSSSSRWWWCWGIPDVWPLHFTIVMHLSVLLGATGAVWAVLNALWGLWQAQHGDMACFLTHARLIA